MSVDEEWDDEGGAWGDFGFGGGDGVGPPGTAASISTAVPPNDREVDVDVAIVGAGIGGLVAGAILNTLYGKKVGVFESHYLPGGCAHAFERRAARCGGRVSAPVPAGEDGQNETTSGTAVIETKPLSFKFDSGPTILLG